MSQDKCTIHVNGIQLEARPGQMLIEVTDAAGIYVPRFCYHEKLSIAANCRMCLVEVENAPKPLPACATPVTPGMKVQTKSVKAIGAQRATMEFLLINHPLDCPICDQGGECELQDLAMGFGRDISRYTERKRVVRDKDIGPLVSTDMTRCIHCTRCVRFTEEVAGYQELGTIGRGDRVEISPYIERTVGHELSGNIIDLCPVGALNSKPFRFSARAWEMSQHATIAPHDSVGSRLYAHVLGGRIKRVVPQPFEAINETWISDRDRFSYEGLYSDDRLMQPMVREGEDWRTVDWDVALDLAVRRLTEIVGNEGGRQIGALVSPSATVEEGYLLSRLLARLGSDNIDHRLRQRDFRGQDSDPSFPSLGLEIADLEHLEQVLIIGSNLRKEAPLLAHRIRKAAVRGAGVHFVNPASFPYLFTVASYAEGTPAEFWLEIGPLLRAASDDSAKLSSAAQAMLVNVPPPSERHRQVVQNLRTASRSAILIGHISQRHPRFGEIAVLATELARLTSSTLGCIPEGANSAGLALAGVLPHRQPGGTARPKAGATAGQMIASPPLGLILFGIEPDLDCAGGEALMRAGGESACVVAFTAFKGRALSRLAHILLPMASFGETAGTYVNAEGRWQSFDPVVRPAGQTRPAWKALRVLCNRAGVSDSDYVTAAAIRDDLRSLVGKALPAISAGAATALEPAATSHVTLEDLDVPIYQIDPLVRRATALQLTEDGRSAAQAPSRRLA